MSFIWIKFADNVSNILYREVNIKTVLLCKSVNGSALFIEFYKQIITVKKEKNTGIFVPFNSVSSLVKPNSIYGV